MCLDVRQRFENYVVVVDTLSGAITGCNFNDVITVVVTTCGLTIKKDHQSFSCERIRETVIITIVFLVTIIDVITIIDIIAIIIFITIY